MLFGPAAHGFTLARDENGNLLTWDRNALPIKFWINIDEPESQESKAKVSAVIRAFKSWETVPDSLASFHYAGITPLNTPAFDGVNLVTWVREGWTHDSDETAYTTLWVTNTGEILDADIELNEENFDWSVDGETELMDIQNSLTHEVGHFMGLDHSLEAIDTSMFPIVRLGEVRKRTVKPDDLEAAASLYRVLSTELSGFELPLDELHELVPADELTTNYENLSKFGRILLASSVRLAGEGDIGLAAMIMDDSGGRVFYLFRKPGDVSESLDWGSRDAWEIPKGTITDFTAIDIDKDGTDEIAVLKVDDVTDYALYIYDAPPPGGSTEENAGKWVARDLWRVPGESDNIALFSLELDGDGRREIATLTYSIEGIYLINAFAPPDRLDVTLKDALAHGSALTIPFTFSETIIDIDAVDVDGDGISEIVVLAKGDDGYSIQLLPLPLPDFLGHVQDLKPMATMPLSLDDGEYPVGVSVLQGDGIEKPMVLLTTDKTGL